MRTKLRKGGEWEEKQQSYDDASHYTFHFWAILLLLFKKTEISTRKLPKDYVTIDCLSSNYYSYLLWILVILTSV